MLFNNYANKTFITEFKSVYLNPKNQKEKGE